MKAIVQHRYGSPDVLELREVDRPVPGEGEVLVRVRAASVHPDVWHVITGVPYVLRIMGSGLRRPRNPIPGTDLAGQVESVGAHVRRFRPGDEVYGENVSGIQWKNGGTYAEFVAASEDRIALKPAGLTFEEAAAVPASAFIALQGVRDIGHVQPGQRVLINGAGGGVGTFAVQMAKAYGAHVTAVDGPAKLDMLRSIGADAVIDYTVEDYTMGKEPYDVIIDVAAGHSLSDCRRVLAATGAYAFIGHDNFGDSTGRWFGSLPRVFRQVVLSVVSKPLRMSFSSPAEDRLAVVTQMVESGVLRPVIDRTFPLDQVPEAIRYLAQGEHSGRSSSRSDVDRRSPRSSTAAVRAGTGRDG